MSDKVRGCIEFEIACNDNPWGLTDKLLIAFCLFSLVQLYGPRQAKASNMFQTEPNTETAEAVKKRQMDDQFTSLAMSRFSYIR